MTGIEIIAAIPLLQLVGFGLGISIVETKYPTGDYGKITPSKGGGIRRSETCQCEQCRKRTNKTNL